MKKARFSRAAYDNQQLQRKQLRCKIDIRYLSDQMATRRQPFGRHLTRRNQGVIGERPAKRAEKKCFVSARLRDGISIWLSDRSIRLIFELFRERIEINGQRIPSPWSRYLRVPGRFKVIGEYAATPVRLRRFEPVHVIIDVAHAGDEFRVCHLQTREALNNSLALTACQQRRDLLILPHNRAHDWMRPDCKQN